VHGVAIAPEMAPADFHHLGKVRIVRGELNTFGRSHLEQFIAFLTLRAAMVSCGRRMPMRRTLKVTVEHLIIQFKHFL
jgi:hypothetical protein